MVKLPTFEGRTALHYAALNGHNEVALFLLELGARHDIETQDGFATPPHLATRRGHWQVANLLLQLGANPNRGTGDLGATPLHVAARSGHLAILKLLLKAKAEISVPMMLVGGFDMSHFNILITYTSFIFFYCPSQKWDD